ncbi:fetuin B [Phyllostomus discolor]|uniref:Fetuin-B n=1 Tax=Phyllostomus discolor TaxID=89673 RepID=A0A6J2L526_9CHIR|nr:fetuin-B [Phyllostomus discolor]KAF6118637.1 fetuin B [Phyllostomus discolor]
MGLFLPLVLCTLAACCTARSVPLTEPSSFSLLSRACNDSDVLAAAGSALQDINSDRKEGYILNLNRVRDAREHRQDGVGSLFYLTLDVLETDCHVLSRKASKDCGVKQLHESVYGECKAIFYINYPKRVLYSPAYNCTLRPVSRRKISSMCPDCPVPSELSDPKVLEVVHESLAKFNNESVSKQYSLFKVTKASMQWVFGFHRFVEYLIKESPCTKSQASSCALQPLDSAPVALCQGSLFDNRPVRSVSVKCNFFESQAPTPGDKNSTANQEPVNLLKVEKPQEKNAEPTYSPSRPVPRGSVQYLPELDDKKPEESQEKGPVEAFPVQLDLTTNPQGETLDVSFLFLEPMSTKLVVLPFPPKEQHSAQCPGPAHQGNSLVLPP